MESIKTNKPAILSHGDFHIIFHLVYNTKYLKEKYSGDYSQFGSFFFFCLFNSSPAAYGGPQARGRIGATAASHSHRNARSYTTTHSNARSLTHWARPVIETETSWFLVGFFSDAQLRELPNLALYLFRIKKAILYFSFTNKTWNILWSFTNSTQKNLKKKIFFYTKKQLFQAS